MRFAVLSKPESRTSSSKDRVDCSVGTGGIARFEFPAANLVEMMLHVFHVIFRDPAERSRLVWPNPACHLVRACGQIFDHMHQQPVIRDPQLNQEFPLKILKALQLDQSFLIVAGKRKLSLQGRADEALMIVAS